MFWVVINNKTFFLKLREKVLNLEYQKQSSHNSFFTESTFIHFHFFLLVWLSITNHIPIRKILAPINLLSHFLSGHLGWICIHIHNRYWIPHQRVVLDPTTIFLWGYWVERRKLQKLIILASRIILFHHLCFPLSFLHLLNCFSIWKLLLKLYSFHIFLLLHCCVPIILNLGGLDFIFRCLCLNISI